MTDQAQSEDLLWGGKAIAEFMFRDTSRTALRRVTHLYETTDVPIFRAEDGPRNLMARPSELSEWLTEKRRQDQERRAANKNKKNGGNGPSAK